MVKRQQARFVKIILTAAFAVTVLALAGCGSSSTASKTSSTTPANGSTAMANLTVAESSLSTMAPDAKLLVVQTAEGVAPTATPVWAYLFGSPSTDKTYVVYAGAGKSMGAQEYGTAGLSKDDWSKVPTSDGWKIDSDSAYTKAFAVSSAKSDPSQYYMYFLTYKPSTDTSTVEPFVWNIQFDPGESGATTNTITVDAKTGETAVSK